MAVRKARGKRQLRQRRGPDLAELGRQVKARRLLRRQTIKELAGQARVSRNVIAQLEKRGEAAGGGSAKSTRNRRLRIDAVLRLARALDGPLEEWLSLAGTDLARREAEICQLVTEINRHKLGIKPDQRLEMFPLEYFAGLEQRLRAAGNAKALMCVSCTGQPAWAAEDREQWDRVLIACIQHGLFLAMTYPYATGSQLKQKPHLLRFYLDVEGQVVSAAHHLRSVLPADLAGRVAVFGPRQEENLVVPPLPLTACQHVLVQIGSSERERELGMWFRLGLAGPERWHILHPIKGNDETTGLAEEAAGTWGDYFAEIIKAWTPESDSGWDREQLRQMQTWRKTV